MKKKKNQEDASTSENIILVSNKDLQPFFSNVEKKILIIARKAQDAVKRNESTIGELLKIVKSYEATLKSYEKHLKSVNDKCENTEETLTNVLLAIRQNEYLQAYYPAQVGFKETKVIGTHPSRSF